MSYYKEEWDSVLTSTAHPQKSYKAIRAEVEWLDKETKGLHSDNRKFFAHVLICTLREIRRGTEGEVFIPVCAKFIHDHFPKARWQKLADRGLLKVTERIYRKYGAGKSREFAIAPDKLMEFSEIASRLSAEEYYGARKFNLVTGKPTNLKNKNVVHDRNRNREPEKFIEAVTTIRNNRRPVNIFAIELLVYERYREWKSLRLQQENEPDPVRAERLYAKARSAYCRWVNDYNCLRTVLDNSTQLELPGMYLYEPAFKPTTTGRATEQGGGLQSCSREMKQASVQDLGEIYNYDLDSSQVNILINWLNTCGIDPAPFEQYVADRNSKHLYADRVGIGTDCWKACFLAFVMGGQIPDAIVMVPNRRTGKKNPKIAIAKNLMKEFDNDLSAASQALHKLSEAITPFREIISHWHRYLETVFIPSIQYRVKGKTYIKNRLEKPMCITSLPASPVKKRAKLAAFLLQGDESLFIHTLTCLGSKYGFKAVGNEHDGIITVGEVPDEAVVEAARLCGLANARMSKKPFAA